jgi:hypothetical protein
MSKDEDAPQEESSSGFTLGNLLLLALAIAALVGLYAFANVHRENEEGGRELPHGTIQLEVANGFDAAARKQVAALEQWLNDSGFDVFGPASQPLLLPGAKPNDEPVAKKLADLTDAEWDVAWRHCLVGEFMVPRVYRLDGKACVVRFAPKFKEGKREFDHEAATRIQGFVQQLAPSFKTVRAYSRLAGLGSELDRDAINVTFGVQTAWVTFRNSSADASKTDTWVNAEGIRRLQQTKAAIFNTHIRSVTTTANAVRYYVSVLMHVTDKDVEVPNDTGVVQRALTGLRRAGINNLLFQNDTKAMVDVTTDTEGTANAELYYHILANVGEALKIQGDTPYLPKVIEHLKDGPGIR